MTLDLYRKRPGVQVVGRAGRGAGRGASDRVVRRKRLARRKRRPLRRIGRASSSTRRSTSIELPLEGARIEREFLNLIANALEAMPDGGCVRIRADRNGDSIVVSVDDKGPGIPASVREHLFQPFDSEGKNGLGLGLGLSRQTALDHGGDLWGRRSRSPAPSSGCVFPANTPDSAVGAA